MRLKSETGTASNQPEVFICSVFVTTAVAEKVAAMKIAELFTAREKDLVWAYHSCSSIKGVCYR